jgi:pimeloyl-ACP methyl ester carboxylesterase
MRWSLTFALVLFATPSVQQAASAQEPAYINPLPATPPYYRVRYDASSQPGELIFPVGYTVWIPPEVKTLRGVVVHQHGCGEGSCKSGQTGVFDLHWQALARKHGCALLSPTYEQPEKADCQMWCDPRNGSDQTFQRALRELGEQSGHPELSTVPWALWGHSGGGHWAGGMLMLHPERVAAAWLRSGVPALTAIEGKPKPHTIPDGALAVPVMLNIGTKEGVTEQGRFAGVWPGNETFFKAMRAKGALIGLSIDPLSSHDCGNQRYLAMPWFDACLSARLPERSGEPLRPITEKSGWLTSLSTSATDIVSPVPADKFTGDIATSLWLPTERVAKAWTEYTRDTRVSDDTPPPAPANLRVDGNVLTWTATADLESGLAGFVIERDGQTLTPFPAEAKNPFGRPIFQNLSYSDTPTQPLVLMRYEDSSAVPGKAHRYRVIAVNTVGLKSE